MNTRQARFNGAPIYDADYYGDDFILDPHPHYRAMRALGPVVFLPRHENYAITRYSELKEAIRNHAVFSSAEGVAADQAGCDLTKGSVITSDPPRHGELRGLVAKPLTPAALTGLRQRIADVAAELVDRLVGQVHFDGIADLSVVLPLTIVRDMVGLPEFGRANMLPWAAATFEILGVQNARGQAAREAIMERRRFEKQLDAAAVTPGSWAAQVFDSAGRGEMRLADCPNVIRSYVGPSLDTTIAATGHLFHYLGANPEQWRILREDRSRIPAAVDEAVRLGTPVRSLSRVTTGDIEVGDTTIPAGARVMLLFGSANRDERRFPDPDRFDVMREDRAHLGFGHGIHTCVGMHLARLEMEMLLAAFLDRVESIDVGTPERLLNNTIHGWRTLPMSVRPAGRVAPASPRPAQEPAPALATNWTPMRIIARHDMATDIAGFDLEPAGGGPAPAWQPGAHVDVKLAPGLIRQYSICGGAAGHLRIAVLRETASRGGSRLIHEQWQPGMTVEIGRPRNAFALDDARHPVTLVAGGIGITPVLAKAEQLHRTGRSFRLVYRVRSRDRIAFADAIAAAPWRDRVVVSCSDEEPSNRFDIFGHIAALGAEQSVHCCGPRRLIEAVEAAAAKAGIAPERVLTESFGATSRAGDAPFTVVAQRTGAEIVVGAGETILHALRRSGIEAPASCEAGVCATCLTTVLDGIPDHRDSIQTAEEKASDARIAICCSRAVGSRLVLDI